MTQIIIGQEWLPGRYINRDAEGYKLATIHLSFEHLNVFKLRVENLNKGRLEATTLYPFSNPVAMDASHTVVSYLKEHGGNCELYPVTTLKDVRLTAFDSEVVRYLHSVLWFEDIRQVVLDFAEGAGESLGGNIEERTKFGSDIVLHALKNELVTEEELQKAFFVGLQSSLTHQEKWLKKTEGVPRSAAVVRFAKEMNE